MSFVLKKAEFLRTVSDVAELKDIERPQIVFLGRSNVGKSTLINRITQQKKLAKTSSTPGHTQNFNLYNIELLNEGILHNLFLVDLPGFGYAKFSKTKREKLARDMVQYLTNGNYNKTICLLNDCRRTPAKEELDLRDLCFQENLNLIVVLTKLDKLKQSKKVKQLRTVCEAYNLELSDMIQTGEKHNINDLFERLFLLL
ncbi:UNVERIFIED_CONTAM: hypothetical protein GTU68_022230 [Idotea baltica]|nr:hypothetical protein [Idotea baltica]